MDQFSGFYRSLDQRIEAIPDGPVASLNRTRWMRWADLVGMLGLVIGLLPSLLILFLVPQQWMVTLARVGMTVIAVGWVPVTLYRALQVIRSMGNWRAEQAEQLDHDFAEWSRLCEWVASHPRELLEKQMRWVQRGQSRLTSKLGFLSGGVERLGVLPLLIALAVQAQIAGDVLEIPRWQLLLGLFAGITYVIALVGSLMRLRLQLYEMTIVEALALVDFVVPERAQAPDGPQERSSPA